MKTNIYLNDERNTPIDIVSKCLVIALGIYILTGGIIANG